MESLEVGNEFSLSFQVGQLEVSDYLYSSLRTDKPRVRGLEPSNVHSFSTSGSLLEGQAPAYVRHGIKV